MRRGYPLSDNQHNTGDQEPGPEGCQMVIFSEKRDQQQPYSSHNQEAVHQKKKTCEPNAASD